MRDEMDAVGTPCTNARTAHWKSAARWRRAVEKALAGSGLTFTQWFVLDGLRELIVETDEAATQTEVAARVELDQGTISLVMATLDRKDLVDRGPDITGRARRTLLTDRSKRLLSDVAAAIEAASRQHVRRDDPVAREQDDRWRAARMTGERDQDGRWRVNGDDW